MNEEDISAEAEAIAASLSPEQQDFVRGLREVFEFYAANLAAQAPDERGTLNFVGRYVESIFFMGVGVTLHHPEWVMYCSTTLGLKTGLLREIADEFIENVGPVPPQEVPNG